MGTKKDRRVKHGEINWPVLIEIKSQSGLVNLRTFVVDDAMEIFNLIDRNRKHLSQHGDETAKKYPNLKLVVVSITNPRNPAKRRFTIRNQAGELVGSVNITPDKNNPTSAEIGYYLGKEFEGRGYMTEAVKALSAYALEQPGCKTLYGKVVEGNNGSVRVLERCGFIETGKTEKNEKVLTLNQID